MDKSINMFGDEIHYDVGADLNFVVADAELMIGMSIEALVGLGIEVEVIELASKIDGGFGLVFMGKEVKIGEEENHLVEDITKEIVFKKIAISQSLHENKVKNSIKAIINEKILNSTNIDHIKTKIDLSSKKTIKSEVNQCINKLKLNLEDEDIENNIDVLEKIKIRIRKIKEKKESYLSSINEVNIKLEKIKDYTQYVDKNSQQVDLLLSKTETINSLTASLNLKSGFILFE